jgi:hypothetical protein
MKPKEMLQVPMTAAQAEHWEHMMKKGQASFVLGRGMVVVGGVVFALSALILCSLMPAVFLNGKALTGLFLLCAAGGISYGKYIWNHLSRKHSQYMSENPR